MSRQKRPDLKLPETDKPLREMTLEERAQYVRKLRQSLRDDAIRVGVRRPRTAREIRIFEEGQAERDARLAKRIARAERKRARDTGQPGDGDQDGGQ